MNRNYELESKGPRRIAPRIMEGNPDRISRPQLHFEKEKHVIENLVNFLRHLLEEKDFFDKQDLDGLTNNTDLLWNDLIKNGYIDVQELHIPDVGCDEDGNEVEIGRSVEHFVTIANKFYETQDANVLQLSKKYETLKDKIYEKLSSYITLSLNVYKRKLIKIVEERISLRFKNSDERLFSSILVKTSIDRVLNPDRVKRDHDRLFVKKDAPKIETTEEIEINGVVSTITIPDDPQMFPIAKNCREVLKEIVNDVYYDLHRRKIASWIKRTKDCDALIVNAPLGLGKTVAIASALNADKSKSAIIFMPRIDLCQELFDKFDKDDCYLIKGATKETCDNFQDVVQCYYERRGKGTVCDSCTIAERCEIKKQYAEARGYRIIITTHAQYRRFYFAQTNPEEWGWEYEINTYKPRDFFVIDENILITQFMKPIIIPSDEFQRDIKVILKSDVQFSYPIKNLLKALLTKVQNADTSVVISPSDKDVSTNFFMDQGNAVRWGIIVDREEGRKKSTIRNLRDLYLSAIKYGAVVRVSPPAPGKPLKELYLFEPIKFDLKIKNKNGETIIPRHVFFDATGVKDEMFEYYFCGAKKKTLTIDVPSIGICKTIKQNEDLSRTSFRTDKRKQEGAKKYLNNIISKHGDTAKYCVIAIKERRKFVEECFKSRGIYPKESEAAKGREGYLVVCHYGAQTGTNIGKECDVGILLGTFRLPVEVIACLALPYIQNVLARNRTYKINNDVVEGSRGKGRVYTPRFSYLEGFDFWRRGVEQEQGLGRTRPLYHDVSFYIVSKDDIRGYWMFKNEDALITPDDVGNRIFFPKERSDSKRTKVIMLARKYWLKQGYFDAPVITKELKLKPRTVQQWIKKIQYIKLAKGYKTKRYMFTE